LSCFDEENNNFNTTTKTTATTDPSKMIRCKSENDTDTNITSDYRLEVSNKYLESIQIKAQNEANLFSKRPRKLEHAMKKSTEARVIFNVPIDDHDHTGVCIYHVNTAWEAMTGFSRLDVVGQSIKSLQVLTQSRGINQEIQKTAVLEASREAFMYDLDVSLTLVCRHSDDSAFLSRVLTNALALTTTTDEKSSSSFVSSSSSVDPAGFRYFLSSLTPCKVSTPGSHTTEKVL